MQKTCLERHIVKSLYRKMEIYNVISFLTLFYSISALSLPHDFTEFENKTNMSSNFQNSANEEKCTELNPHCLETGGSCVFEKDKNIICKCPENELYINSVGCQNKCSGLDCRGNGECEIVNNKATCKCKDGYNGENCEIVPETICKNKIFKCVETGGRCISVDDHNITCKCPLSSSFLENVGCKFSKHACFFERYMCEETGGFCMPGKDNFIECLCPEKTEFKKDIGCKALNGTCSKHRPNCEETGGYCVSDENKIIQCKCPAYTEYVNYTGCQVTDEMCPFHLPWCKATGGFCIPNKDKIIDCVCPEETEFQTGIGCKALNGTCSKHQPNCEETGGYCVSTKNKTIRCECRDYTRYKNDGCQMSEENCTKLFSNCVDSGGVCIWKSNASFYCKCGAGIPYDAELGCKNKCASVKCYNGGTCVLKNETAVCSCTDRFTGNYCENDKCTNVTCQNGGKCIIIKGKAACNCTDKYTGKFCQTDLISIEDSGIHVSVYFNSKNSSMNGTKFDFHFGRKEDSNHIRTQLLLRLESESIISTSDHKCSKMKCKNGGKCVIENEKAVCKCSDKYTGDYCEKECNCENGICKEVSGKTECACYPEYGKYKSGVCKACECGMGANCTFIEDNFLVLKTKTCICPENSVEVGGVCVDPDLYNPCLNNPCRNGAHCQKNEVRAKCICRPGYKGELCQYDKCSQMKCQNGGKCEIKDEKAVCICRDAYAGNYCEIDRCSLIKCQNGGKCDINDGKAFCECDDKYVGEFCEIHKCSLMKCLNGGKCAIINQKTVCVCDGRFTGDFCEKDKCSLIKCQNGGKCYVQNGQALCKCPDKFTGDHCERKNSVIRK